MSENGISEKERNKERRCQTKILKERKKENKQTKNERKKKTFQRKKERKNKRMKERKNISKMSDIVER